MATHTYKEALKLAGSHYKVTYRMFPGLWEDGLSFLTKAELTDGRQVVNASGWHKRVIAFDYPDVQLLNDDVDLREALPSPVKSFEVELALTDALLNEAQQYLAHFVTPLQASGIIESLATIGTQGGVDAKGTTHPLELDGVKIPFIDLLCQNMPSRSGQHRVPLMASQRWCRVLQVPGGVITLYAPMNADNKAQLRFPNNCMPVTRAREYYTDPSKQLADLATAVNAPIDFESYNLNSWESEAATWENKVMQVLSADNHRVASANFRSAQRELGVLSQFLSEATLSTRNLERKLDNSPLAKALLKQSDDLKDKLSCQKEQVAGFRKALREASGTLANTAQSLQTAASERQARSSQGINDFLSYATVIFLIPTLFISFFSMTIVGEGSNQNIPKLSDVLIWCVIAIIIGVALVTLARFLFTRFSDRHRPQ